MAAFLIWESELLKPTELRVTEKKSTRSLNGLLGVLVYEATSMSRFQDLHILPGRTEHHPIVTNLMSILSLEEDASCALATPSLGCSITLLGQLLLNSVLCVRNHTSVP